MILSLLCIHLPILFALYLETCARVRAFFHLYVRIVTNVIHKHNHIICVVYILHKIFALRYKNLAPIMSRSNRHATHISSIKDIQSYKRDIIVEIQKQLNQQTFKSLSAIKTSVHPFYILHISLGQLSRIPNFKLCAE